MAGSDNTRTLSVPAPTFAVAICTRNRAAQLSRTLAALAAQTDRSFPVLVVDQSDAADPALARSAAECDRLLVVRDPGRGLSRARNIAWRRLHTEWIVFVDDDCITAPDWAEALGAELAGHPEADFLSGHVGAGDVPDGPYAPVTTYPVLQPRTRRGRWTTPYAIGFGVCMAVRRSTIERLGGWDERLGTGAPDFQAAEDMDFNYRLLRAGGTAHATPSARAVHEQWRHRDEVPALWRRYMVGWAGFSVKTLKSGDVRGGLWLLALGVGDTLRVFVGAVRRRSRLHWRIGVERVRGLVDGVRRAWPIDW